MDNTFRITLSFIERYFYYFPAFLHYCCHYPKYTNGNNSFPYPENKFKFTVLKCNLKFSIMKYSQGPQASAYQINLTKAYQTSAHRTINFHYDSVHRDLTNTMSRRRSGLFDFLNWEVACRSDGDSNNGSTRYL